MSSLLAEPTLAGLPTSSANIVFTTYYGWIELKGKKVGEITLKVTLNIYW